MINHWWPIILKDTIFEGACSNPPKNDPDKIILDRMLAIVDETNAQEIKNNLPNSHFETLKLRGQAYAFYIAARNLANHNIGPDQTQDWQDLGPTPENIPLLVLCSSLEATKNYPAIQLAKPALTVQLNFKNHNSHLWAWVEYL